MPAAHPAQRSPCCERQPQLHVHRTAPRGPTRARPWAAAPRTARAASRFTTRWPTTHGRAAAATSEPAPRRAPPHVVTGAVRTSHRAARSHSSANRGLGRRAGRSVGRCLPFLTWARALQPPRSRFARAGVKSMQSRALARAGRRLRGGAGWDAGRPGVRARSREHVGAIARARGVAPSAALALRARRDEEHAITSASAGRAALAGRGRQISSVLLRTDVQHHLPHLTSCCLPYWHEVPTGPLVYIILMHTF